MTGLQIKDTLERAKIHMTEAAELFFVRRSTLYKWFDGTMPRNRFVYNNAEKTVQKIEAALKAGYLPLQGGNAEERLTELRSILRIVL